MVKFNLLTPMLFYMNVYLFIFIYVHLFLMLIAKAVMKNVGDQSCE